MIKHLKILLFGMAVIGLMAGTAFAGTTKVNHAADNTPFTASLEAMSAARNVMLLGAANGPINYLVTQVITGGNFLTVSFTGAAFAGNQVRVCKVDGAAAGNQIGVATPASGTTSYNFQIAASNAAGSVPAGESVYLTTEAACNATGAGSNLWIQLSTTASATSPSATVGFVSAGNLAVDTGSSAPVATIAAEYRATVAANNNTVDYLGTPGDGTRFILNRLYANSGAVGGAANIVQTRKNYGAANAGEGNLTTRAVVQFTDTASWQGLSKVFLSNLAAAANCANDNAAANLIGTGTLSGTLSLSIPAAAFDGDGANGSANFMLCVVANGTAALSTPRTLQSSIDVNVTSGNDPAATAFGTIDIWDTNAYQGNPVWLVNSTVAPTYCLINNTDTTRTATVLLDVMSSESAVVLSGSLGTLAPKTSNMVTFTANSASLTGGTALSLSTLGADKRYTSKVTVTVNPNNASMTCIQTDPVTGAKRAVPVLSNSGWTQ